MKIKITFLISLIGISLFLMKANATNYFVSSNASGITDGLTWENAFSIADLQNAMDAGDVFTDGDIIHIAGGTYVCNLAINKGLTIIGGYPDNLKGTDIPELSYPSATPTILSGDLNGDNIANEGDYSNVIAYRDISDASVLCGLEFRNCYYTSKDAYQCGAVVADYCNSQITIENCRFVDNVVTGQGGAALSNSGANLIYVKNCEFSGNKAGKEGSAFRSSRRSATINGNKVYIEPNTIFEGCLFDQNEIVTSGKYGAVHLQHGNAWFANCTFAGNKAYSHSAAISLANQTTVPPTQAYIMSCTFGGNVATRVDDQSDTNTRPYSYGTSIRMSSTSRVAIANTIMVNNTDPGNYVNPVLFWDALTDKASSQLISGGANILGTCFVAVKDDQADTDNYDSENIWKSSDNVSNLNTMNSVFGENKLVDNGGFTRTISPINKLSGLTVDDLYEIWTGWACPIYDVALDFDQRGFERTGVTCIGAYEYGAIGLDNVEIKNGSNLAKIAENTYSIVGAEKNSEIEVYDINGRLLKVSISDSVDLSDLERGIYLLVSGNQSFKVIR